MSEKNTTDGERGIDRRTILRSAALASAGGLVGVPTFSGAAMGQGPSDPCEECGALLAKYEWNEEDGEFVFEEGRDSLDIDDDSFDVTVTESKEDEEGEPLCVEFDSDIYEASCGFVKAGPDSRSLDFDGYVGNDEICAEDKYAISNFALCIEHAFWQFDLGTGTINDPPYYQNQDAKLLIATTYGRNNPTDPEPDTIVFNQDDDIADLTKDDVSLTYDGDVPTSVTVPFEVSNAPKTVHLGSWEMPGPWKQKDIEYSVRYDYEEEEFSEGTHELTVDLPTL